MGLAGGVDRKGDLLQSADTEMHTPGPSPLGDDYEGACPSQTIILTLLGTET